MKRTHLLVAALALPASIAFAQTPPATDGSSSSIPFIPLIGSTGGTTSGSNSSAWFIDVAARQVVLCAQSGTTSFTCSAQPIPAAPSSGGGTPPAGDAGAPPADGSTTPPADGSTTPDATTPPATGMPAEGAS